MIDPVISGAGSKANTEMFREASKQLQNANDQVSKFEELRSKMEVQEMTGPQKGQQDLKVQQTDQINEMQSTEKVNPLDQAVKTGEIPRITDLTDLQGVVDRLKNDQTRLNDLIKDCTSGRTFSPQEMLGLQAEISSITTEIQLASKIVEQGVSGIKQTMQMQV